MADYIYTMEIRLTPEQQRAAAVIQEVARNAGLNVYMTGGAIRDLISGFTIRDLDFTVQGNPLKLQKELERRGARIAFADDHLKELHLVFPGNVRAEMGMARTERYEKVGKPPVISPSTILEDLRRRDFTMNAMALSLNPGSRGLLMDPFNGIADVEAKLIRILNNYSFAEDPSRLIRATRFNTRFHWPMEERTQARYQSAKENDYIEYISDAARGYEIEQLAYEDDPLAILRALESEGWLKALHPHWTGAKIDVNGLGQLLKTRQQMNDFGLWPDTAPAMLHFLAGKMGEKDVAEIRKLIPRKDLVGAWKALDTSAKELSKQLQGKEAATASKTWNLLSRAQPEALLFLSLTGKNATAMQKVKNFFTKWREVRQRIPLPEMTEMRITPQIPEYEKIANDVFMLLLDGKLRTHNELMKFLKPLAPPPPPPPPPVRRGRGAKAAAVPAAAASAPAPAAAVAGKKRGKAKAAEAVAPVPAAAPETPTKPAPSKAAEVAVTGKKAAKGEAAPAVETSKAPAKPKAAAAAATAAPQSRVEAKAAPKPASKPAAKVEEKSAGDKKAGKGDKKPEAPAPVKAASKAEKPATVKSEKKPEKPVKSDKKSGKPAPVKIEKKAAAGTPAKAEKKSPAQAAKPGKSAERGEKAAKKSEKSEKKENKAAKKEKASSKEAPGKGKTKKGRK